MTVTTETMAVSPRSSPMTTLAARPGILASSQFASFSNSAKPRSAMNRLTTGVRKSWTAFSMPLGRHRADRGSNTVSLTISVGKLLIAAQD